eukprot:EG_transcript_34552
MGSWGTSLCGALGLLLSLYALYVEHESAANPGYRPLCDNKWMSCSRVFSSEYGRLLFGISNAAWGTGFYALTYVLGFTSFVRLTLALAIAACLGSLGLAYILYAILGDFCIVCASMYAVNAALLLISWRRYRRLKPVRKAL